MTRPRVLFVGPTRYALPLAAGLRRKWEAIESQVEFRVLARGDGADPRFELVRSDFYARLPLRVRNAIRAFRPQAIVAEDLRTAALAMSGRALAGRRMVLDSTVRERTTRSRVSMPWLRARRSIASSRSRREV